ncbi:DASH complex, subunit Spc34 [Myriangium duriaei CBS 260.36]|uniref:DASH complex subunit SPC34 n=1 Tax=Myriangium duriaei CBS 260.36 TaxID=1168546 RepID=A0A9P4MGY4_9PEZI|nr:DASH complex, subunit Spc34 [Myriangium duriaei CBS 260.36]
MGSLLASHLEQISLCAASISELDFPGPKQFTHALLGRHDITALIRDTEIHERALFSIAPPTLQGKGESISFSGSTAGSGLAASRQSIAPHATRAPKRNTAVAAVLGRDLFRKVREAHSATAQTGPYGERPRGKGGVDVDVLLEGATRLCDVYPIPGAMEEIGRLRARHEQLRENIAHYEDKVARNARQLEGMKKWGYDEMEDDDVDMQSGDAPELSMTKEDLEREEREIRELERKKKGLESRVSEMEKDLGGLMR